jgi:hypothetical protein
MFYPEDQLKGQVNSCERQILWHIWKELQKLTAGNAVYICPTCNQEHGNIDDCRSCIDSHKPKAGPYICPVCKTEHDNKGKLLACQRKHKREAK